jgi:hypothetical protein
MPTMPYFRHPSGSAAPTHTGLGPTPHGYAHRSRVIDPRTPPTGRDPCGRRPPVVSVANDHRTVRTVAEALRQGDLALTIVQPVCDDRRAVRRVKVGSGGYQIPMSSSETPVPVPPGPEPEPPAPEPPEPDPTPGPYRA